MVREERNLPIPSAERLLDWRVRSETCLSRRKQWACAYVEPFSLGAFGLFSRPPHLEGIGVAESSDASDPIFAYGDREVLGEKRSWRNFSSDREERERGCGRKDVQVDGRP